MVDKKLLERVANPKALINELQRRDFGSFVIGAFAQLKGGATLAYNWHIDAIALELAKVRDLKTRRLLVNIAPRSLKSMMISVAWPAWCLGHDPTMNFVCISYSTDLASKHAHDTRSLMQTAWYRNLFPRAVLHRSRYAVNDFETTRGGGRLAGEPSPAVAAISSSSMILPIPMRRLPMFAARARTTGFATHCHRA